MLSKPSAGWTVVTIGEMKFDASYMTDIPIDCLTAAKDYLSGAPLLALYFDMEVEGDLYVVSDNLGTSVITETDEWDDENCNFKYKIEHISISASTLIREMVMDIKTHADKWANWSCFDEYDPNKRVEIDKLLKEVSEAQKTDKKEYTDYWK